MTKATAGAAKARKPRVYDYSHLPPYRPMTLLPEVTLVDLDGTLALRREDGRGPYDEARVGEDLVNTTVLRSVCAHAVAGIPPVFVSGRRDTCYDQTEAWLRRHCPVRWLGLFMRPAADGRPDWQVKYDLFVKEIVPRWRPFVVFDDRNQVVGMWRAIGLPVFQVAESPD